MQKPTVLYHASTSTAIKEFEPRNEAPRYDDEPNFVFATPYPSVAAMFLIPKEVPVEIGTYGNRQAVFINADKRRYLDADRGGAIYSLPADSFETNAAVGMGKVEWVSRIPVRPVAVELFQTAFEAMQKYAVEIYFVDDETLKSIQADPAHALDLVKDNGHQRW